MCYTEGINTLPKGGYRNLHAEIVCSKTPKNMKPLDNDTSPNGIKHEVADHCYEKSLMLFPSI